MSKRKSVATVLLITAVPLVAGSYLLLEYAGDSLPVVILVFVALGVWMAYNIKFMFFSGNGKE
jgi:NAD/NADP transhydrogenase beta subunit